MIIDDIDSKRMYYAIGLFFSMEIMYFILIYLELPTIFFMIILWISSTILGILSIYTILSVFEHEKNVSFDKFEERSPVSLKDKEKKRAWDKFWVNEKSEL